MREKTLLLLSLLCIPVILGSPIFGFGKNQGSPPTFGQLRLITWQLQPITKYENANVLVNITSTTPIETVTLFYCLFSGPSSSDCPNRFAHNSTAPMFKIYDVNNATFGEYEATLPQLLGSGEVWGEARAIDVNGQVGWSDSQSRFCLF